MKLKELIKNEIIIKGNDLSPMIDLLKECEEFQNCDELIILKEPVFLDENGKTKMVQTFKVDDNNSFKGKCYLYSIGLTPEMFDPNKINDLVNDGASITPAIVDPSTLTLKKKIIIEFEPETLQDEAIYGLGSPSMIEDAENERYKSIRKKLHQTLDNILDSPQDYQIKGERGVMIRGVFEIKKNDEAELTHPNHIETINPYSNLFFLEKQRAEDGDFSMALRSMLIPSELGSKYIKELGHKGINVTRQEINEFLNKHKTI
jgi:hypothetical protein